MFEAILQEGEQIVMQESGIYCGGAATAAIKEARIVLTNRRILVVKGGGSGPASWITTVIAVAAVVVVPRVMGVQLGVLWAGLLGGLAGGVAHLISSKLFKGKEKPVKAEDVVHSFNFENIKSVEDATRGVNRDMIGITTNSDVVCKIGRMKNMPEWRAAIEKQRAN